MGGAVVIRHAALYGGVDAVVSVSAPARWYYRGTVPMRRVHWVIERPAGRLAVRLARGTRVARTGWDPVPEAPHEVAGRIAPVPFLIVHGDADPFLPPTTAGSSTRPLATRVSCGWSRRSVTRRWPPHPI